MLWGKSIGRPPIKITSAGSATRRMGQKADIVLGGFKTKCLLQYGAGLLKLVGISKPSLAAGGFPQSGRRKEARTFLDFKR